MIALGRMSTSRGSRAAAAVALSVPLVMLAGCTGDPDAARVVSDSATSSQLEVVPGWPSAMAAIGHSGLTGYDSESPGADARENSWATGENPEVDSVYLRIVAGNPAMTGNAVNLAVDGSGVTDLLRQANDLADVSPAPELVLIQSIDNDIRCDGTDAENLPAYREGLVKVMDALSAGLPDAKVFFVSQWGSVESYDAAAFARDPSHLQGNGLCDTVDPATMQIVPEKEAYLQSIVDQYFATVVEVCSSYDGCETDNGAMQTMRVAPEDLTPDLNHLTVSGHAKMAEIVWDVIEPDE